MSLHSSRPLGTSLVAGLGTLTLTAVLWTWFDFSTLLTSVELTYLAVGAFLLGALPAALITSKRLLTPVVVVAGLFTLSAYGTWSTYVAPATPPTPVDPTPFGWYLLGWPVVVAAALLVGGAEYGLRQYRTQSGESNGSREV